ncbi:P-loop NTPase fold protein [Clostridium sp.]|uniref:P-loop NTPase fold protein n=1 Tax=Clostridium sp. TaxID=1506 RepID=UPI0028419DC3|nr:P-loop NTPase fold protein [Clostridium sp.]MDR3597707.1 P-loop NTPase fold protein [Clostridium sp.]
MNTNFNWNLNTVLQDTNIRNSANDLISFINTKSQQNQNIILIPLILCATIVIIINIYMCFKKGKKLYNYELTKTIKFNLIVLAISMILGKLSIPYYKAINTYIVEKYLSIIYLVVVTTFIIDILLYIKNFKLAKFVNYTYILKSVTYGVFILCGISNISITINIMLFSIILSFFECWLKEKMKFKKDKKLNKLYEPRENDLKKLKDIITMASETSCCIAINGEWGSGKSQLIDNLTTQLKEENNHIIYIKPMINDTKESLLNNFKKELESIMIASGVYSSRMNSVENYCKEALDLILINSKITLRNLVPLNNKELTFKESKALLQYDIDTLLTSDKSSNRLFIIIDDFDRVEDKNQLEILSFINEIVDFKGCITLIALDYGNFKDDKIVNRNYIEKFVSNTVELSKINYEDIIDVHFEKRLDRKFHVVKKDKNRFITLIEGLKRRLKAVIKIDNNKKEASNEDNIDKSPIETIRSNLTDNKLNYYKYFNDKMDLHIKELKQEISYLENNNADKNKETIEEKKSKLVNIERLFIEKGKYIENSRRVIQFLDEIGNMLIGIKNIIDKAKQQQDNSDFYRVLEKMDLAEIIYKISYIKIFCKDDYDKLKVNGDLLNWMQEMKNNSEIHKYTYYEKLLDKIIKTSSEREHDKLSCSNNIMFITYALIKGRHDLTNLELYTETEKILKQFDGNEKIEIEKDYVEYINHYKRIIDLNTGNNDTNLKRHRKLAECMAELYNSEKISEDLLVGILRSGNINKVSDYTHCYINVFLDNLNENILRNFIVSTELRDEDTFLYGILIEQAINVGWLIRIHCFRKNIKLNERLQLIQDTYYKSSDFIKELCIKEKLIDDIKLVSNLDLCDILEHLNSNLKSKYKDVDYSHVYYKIENLIYNIRSYRELIRKNNNEAEISLNFNMISNYSDACETINKYKSTDIIYKRDDLKCIERSLEKIVEEYDKCIDSIDEKLVEKIQQIIIQIDELVRMEPKNAYRVTEIMFYAERIFTLNDSKKS